MRARLTKKRLLIFVALLLITTVSVAAALNYVGSIGLKFNVNSGRIFTFAAGGDHSFGTAFQNSLNKLQTVNPDFYIALGDLSYSGQEQNWCNTFKANFNNIEIITGNHDSGEDASGNINLYAQYCPFTFSTYVSSTNCGTANQSIKCYGKEYYFDFPKSNPIARFILISPGVNQVYDGTGTWTYNVGSARYNWVASAIDDARTKSLRWVIVAMHKDYISAGGHGNEIGSDLFNLLVNKKVDLVLQGHSHNYQRSKQVAVNTNCSSVPITYNSACVVDDGAEGQYLKGAGTVWSILGTFGQGFAGISTNLNWFAATNSATHGFTKFSVFADRIEAQFINADGTFTDAFKIVSSPPLTTFLRNPVTPLLLGHTEPDVIQIGTTFYLYFRNDSSAGASIGVATSTDGLSWHDVGIILTKSTNGWDSAEVISPSVIEVNNTFYLYYEADDASNVGHRAIGLATSTSPTGPFTKLPNPVLGPTASWEATIVGTPAAAQIGSKFFLFYHGFQGGSDRGGVAYSNDLISWSKEPNNPILNLGSSGAWDSVKVAPSDTYVSGSNVWVFYEGYNGTAWRIGIATGSPDPSDGRIKSLTKQPSPVIDLGAPGSWDSKTVQLPSIISVGTEIWLYYSGNDGLAFRLGRAVASISLLSGITSATVGEAPFGGAILVAALGFRKHRQNIDFTKPTNVGVGV